MSKKANLKEVKSLLVDKLDKQYETKITLDNYEYLPVNAKATALRQIRSENPQMREAVAKMLRSIDSTKF